jgi:hypothetical protein
MVPFVAIIPDLQTNFFRLHVHCRSAPDTSKTRTATTMSVGLPSFPGSVLSEEQDKVEERDEVLPFFLAFQASE